MILRSPQVPRGHSPVRRQGQRVGVALLEASLAAMISDGAGEICLGVWEGNHKAQAIYARYGFTKVGEYDFTPIGAQVDREWIMRKSRGG